MTIRRSRSASFRYRVSWLFAAYEGYDGELTGSTFETREFKTRKAAEAYQRRLADKGKDSVLQVGVLQWMPHDEAAALMEELARRMELE